MGKLPKSEGNHDHPPREAVNCLNIKNALNRHNIQKTLIIRYLGRLSLFDLVSRCNQERLR